MADGPNFCGLLRISELHLINLINVSNVRTVMNNIEQGMRKKSDGAVCSFKETSVPQNMGVQMVMSQRSTDS